MVAAGRLAIALMVVWPLAAVASSWPVLPEAEPAPSLTPCSELELRVAGLFRVGIARLYLDDCANASERVLDAVPKRFSLELARSLRGADLNQTAVDLLTANLHLNSAEALPAPLACLADAYVDVARGDRYDVIYRPRESLSLYLNDELLRRCEDSGQGEKFFLIWFGDAPFHRRLRDELLNRAAHHAG